MAQALITVNGGAGSNLDLPLNTVINLSNQNTGGEVTYAWSILAQPPGPADSLTSTTTLNTTLTPRKEGTYLIRLVVNATMSDEASNQVVVAVRDLKTRTRIPATGEETEAGTAGWSDPDGVDAMLRLVQARAADPGIMVAAANASLAIGNVVRFLGAPIIKSGLPGEERVPQIALAQASTAAQVQGALGVVLGAVDQGGISAGTLVFVRIFGLVDADLGSPAVEALVYVDDAGALSTTAGTTTRVVGKVGVSSGVDVVHFNGLSAAGGTVSVSAADVTFAPDGDIAATNVQDAVVEVRDETDTKLANKAPLDINVITVATTTLTYNADLHRNAILRCTNASGCLIAVNTAALSAGCQTVILRDTAGAVGIDPSSTATGIASSAATGSNIQNRGEAISLIGLDANTYTVQGPLA